MTRGVVEPAGGPTVEAPAAGPDRRPFLPLPPALVGRQRLVHRLVLALILAFGLAKGGYWAVTTQVWNPIDEAQHFGYVESIATGHGVPTVGRDLLSDQIIASVKSSTTSGYRSEPFQVTNSDPAWSSTRHQYEAVHGPIYYALMAPAYWAGHHWGTDGSLLAIRLATVVMALGAVPLTWLLARRLFPLRPAAWLLAPALLVTISGLNFGSVTNDALVLTLGTAATVATLRALSRPDRWWTIGAGLLLGLTLVTKTSSAGLIPFLGLAYLAWVVAARPGWRAAGSWLAWFAVGGTVAVAPWLAWNLATYHAISASKAVDALTGSAQTPTPLSWAGIVSHSQGARWGLWVSQLALDGAYRVLWERVLLVALAAGLVAAAVRRSWRELAALVWCATALLFAFAGLEVLVFTFFGGHGGPTGRYFYGAMAPTMVMVAAAATLVLGRYWAPVVITALITWSLVLESRLINDLVNRTYLTTVIDGRLAPAVSQTWADHLVAASAIEADPGCAVEVIDLGATADPPASIVVADTAGTQTATVDRQPGSLHRYRLPRPTEGPFTVRLPPGTNLAASVDDRAAAVAFPAMAGDPVIRLYCDQGSTDAADRVAFTDVFPPEHLKLTLGTIQAIPEVFVAGAGAATVVTLGWATMATIDHRRRRSAPPPSAPSPGAG